MSSSLDSGDPFPAQVSAAVAAARERLERKMEEAGLHAADQWQINERVIDVDGGSRWVLTPIHPIITVPQELTEMVDIPRVRNAG